MPMDLMLAGTVPAVGAKALRALPPDMVAMGGRAWVRTSATPSCLMFGAPCCQLVTYAEKPNEFLASSYPSSTSTLVWQAQVCARQVVH